MRSLVHAITAFTAIVAYPLLVAAAEKASVGDVAPKFVVDDDQGKPWASDEHIGKKIVVLYFYPADMTGGCTAQACSFRDDMGSLASSDVEVIGISGDTVENHQQFKHAHSLNFTLLADVDGKVADLLGVPKTVGAKTVQKTIGGTSYTLTRNVTTRRWTFIFDREGKIAYIDDSVKAKKDSKAVAEFIKSMN